LLGICYVALNGPETCPSSILDGTIRIGQYISDVDRGQCRLTPLRWRTAMRPLPAMKWLFLMPSAWQRRGERKVERVG